MCGLVAHRSKANKQVRLVESKVGWQLVGRADICPKTDSSHCNQRAVAAIDRIGRGWGCGLHVERAVSFDSHLETGHWWSDQHHLGCLRYISFSAPGLVYFHFFETNSRNCGSLSCGYSLVIMALTFLPGVSGSVRKLIGYGSEYCL